MLLEQVIIGLLLKIELYKCESDGGSNSCQPCLLSFAKNFYGVRMGGEIYPILSVKYSGSV